MRPFTHRTHAFVALFSIASFSTLVACGSADSDAPSGPAPTDPIVYDASAETTAQVGIAKWGYAAGPAAEGTIFRGYGAHNELLVEIRQSYTETDEFTKSFDMTMTGSAATGSEHIDFVAQWTKDGESMEYVTNVRENTFTAGSTAARILARLKPDAAAMLAAAPSQDGTSTPTNGGTLTKSVHPLDDSPTVTPGQTTTSPGMSVVTPGDEPLLVCCSQLTRESADESASAADSCPLVTPGDDPVSMPSGDLVGRELVLGKDGKTPTVKSPWAGPYNIVDHHCHNAAAQNSSKTDGYIACDATSSTTSTQGHTINWGPDPSAKGKAGAFCAYEPQSNGGTSSSNSVCCWQGDKAADGSPLFNAPASQGCATKLCLGQASFAKGATPPKAFPAGSTPPVPNDCPGSTGTQAACDACCKTQADNVNGLFGKTAPYTQQVADYRKRCSAGCLQAETARKPKAPAQQCMQSAAKASSAKTNASSSCSASK